LLPQAASFCPPSPGFPASRPIALVRPPLSPVANRVKQRGDGARKHKVFHFLRAKAFPAQTNRNAHESTLALSAKDPVCARRGVLPATSRAQKVLFLIRKTAKSSWILTNKTSTRIEQRAKEMAPMPTRRNADRKQLLAERLICSETHVSQSHPSCSILTGCEALAANQQDLECR